MPLTIYTSNRMEALVEQLCAVVEPPLSSPFVPETIVVQSRGMERWLAMELAKRLGIWANGSYPFPNAFVWSLFRAALPHLPDQSPFDPAILTWRIMDLLPRLLPEPAFGQLRGYLAGEDRELRLYQLAARIADTFDQYTVFRGDLLTAWETGRDQQWQARLWRALTADSPGTHRGAVRDAFLKQLAGGRLPAGVCPERVSVFGISYLPPFHLEIFTSLARLCPVNLFVLSPCREYWGDIVSPGARARMTPERRQQAVEGHPLLASLGKPGRDFSSLILACDDLSGGERDLYAEAPGETLLAAVQNGILTLDEADGTPRLVRVDPGDRSIGIHSCHGPMREAEVLHDVLLAMFEELPDLTPRDIIVMTPDIETYAPYVAAVFGGGQDQQRRRIPFSIADRSIRCTGGAADTFLAILDLPLGRFPVTDVLDILETGAVHRRFGIDEAGLEQIRSWVEATRIRWGMDENERRAAGLPAYRENSWQAGLDRLLLGVAMPDEEGAMFGGILPHDAMEGDGPVLLGRFIRFVEALDRVRRDLVRPRSLEGWTATLRGILADFFNPDDATAFERAALGRIVDGLGELGAGSGFTDEVGRSVIRAWLGERLDKPDQGLGFMTGGVTFCAMLPMRSIPFRVICLLGVNDDSFPRRDRAAGFDLMAADRRPGDRSLREEDRYLFLEALLSARERLVISYTGQSVRDNAELPPSVLVSEFLDYLGSRFTDGTDRFPASLVTRHRLQPFSPAYFTGDGGLFSYAAEECRALARRDRGDAPRPFLEHPLASPASALADETEILPLAQLISFFEHPVRYLMRHRLGIRLEESRSPLEDREPFALDSLDAFLLEQEILDHILAGGDPADLLPVARARGGLPPARQGELAFAGLTARVRDLADRVRLATSSLPPFEPVTVDLRVGERRLVGELGSLWPAGLIRWRCAKLSGRDHIRLWIEHLVLNALAGPATGAASRLLAADGELALRPVADPLAHLEALVSYYRQGSREPLRFFPRSSLAFARTGEMAAARTTWEGDFYPEGDDPYHALCFGTADPLDDAFRETSVAILTPLLAHREDER